MKNKIITTILTICTWTNLLLPKNERQPNPYPFPSYYPTKSGDPMEPVVYAPYYHTYNPPHYDPNSPGFNAPDDDPKFHGVRPIPFKPENGSTGVLYGPDKDAIGYFWNIKDNDPSLIYPGKARIGNDHFINVVVVDTKQVDHTGEADSFSYTDVENIYDQSTAQKQSFHNDFLVKIGTFIHGSKVYDLYGQYESTVVPDPETVEYT
jgi:hypothetical protein